MTKPSSASITIRPLTEADLADALDMWVATWQAAYPKIDFKARRDWMQDRIAELEESGSQSFVAVLDDAIVGMLIVNPASGYLDQICVATDRQGQGLAETLLDKARRVSPQLLDLHVNKDNARAIAFYRKQGFAVTGEATNPTSGKPIYLMRWTS